ncbi:MAG: phenylalanine--tRNA ligase subunit beta [Aquisalimonadaceae bacterium]
MKISEQWLRDLLPVTDGPQALADRLTMAGLEVDGMETAAPAFSGVLVGEITACEPHPDADRLRYCTVDTGAEPLRIVCGAPNARVGLKAPVATVGGILPGDFKIKKAKLRGLESFGMLCSAKELGLSEDAAGLLELPADAPIGRDLRDYLGLDDHIIEVDLTPNRSDCLGMFGVAREVSALTGIPFSLPAQTPVPARLEDQFPIELEVPAACPRYVGRIVRGVNPQAETPLWMRERLRRVGIRSLGPIVDVTNYVMIEHGQPMHAFDLATLHGGIRVRMAEQGEELALLNGETAVLNDDTLVIADQQRAVALAGIMGGSDSAVSDQTRDILLESAFFSPRDIAGKARGYGLHTDSSHRFERGVDPAGQSRAMERATELLLAISGGEPGPLLEARDQSQLPEARTVRLRPQRIERLLGMAVPEDAVEGILGRLGMEVFRDPEGSWSVTVPAFRFDVGIEVDLIEELARVWGYDRIPTRNPATPVTVLPSTETQVSLSRIRHALVDRGYQEAVTYSFVEPRLQTLLDPEHAALPLANPISADLSVMRTSLWPGLMAATLYNQNRQHERLRLFETGLRFRGDLNNLEQSPMLAAVIAGSALPEQWGVPGRTVDYFDLKGDLQSVLGLGGAAGAFRFEVARHPALHPGQSARIYREDRAVGWIGALHPAVQDQLGLAGQTYLFEVELSALQAANVPVFAPLSRYPSIRRDLALVVEEGVSYGAVEACVRAAAGEMLQNLLLFDVYEGGNIAEGSRSLGMGLIMQDFSRTLTDSDVDRLVDRVIERLGRDLNAQLRG